MDDATFLPKPMLFPVGVVALAEHVGRAGYGALAFLWVGPITLTSPCDVGPKRPLQPSPWDRGAATFSNFVGVKTHRRVAGW